MRPGAPPTSSKSTFEFLPALSGTRGSSKLNDLERAVLEDAANNQTTPGSFKSLSASSHRPEKVRPSKGGMTKLHRSRGLGNTGVAGEDLQAGVLSCIQRGLLPPTFDTTAVIAGPSGVSNPLSVSTAPVYKHVEQFRRRDILTAEFGMTNLCNVKLDMAAIAKIPRDATAASLAAGSGATVPANVVLPTSLPVPAPPGKPTPAQLALDDAEAKQREDARTYTELLDMYSLHEFIIRKGQALRNTPEFTSYQRMYKAQWGSISQLIGDLEELLTDYNVPLAYVDGKKLCALAAIDVGKPTQEELLSCLANRVDVEPLLVSNAQQFHSGTKGQHAAAMMIQSIARMFLQRKAYHQLRLAMVAAKKIQAQWRVHLKHVRTREILSENREKLFTRWKETMNNFVQSWSRIKESKKVVVHLFSSAFYSKHVPVPGASMGEEFGAGAGGGLFSGSHGSNATSSLTVGMMPSYKLQQAAQLPRLASLVDPTTEIILITPFKLDPDALSYYYSMLTAAGVPAPESRVMMLVPELMERLPPWISVSRALLCSSKLMRSLSALLKGKISYILPNAMGHEERLLAATLNIPMLAPDPRVASAFGTHSGSKVLFESADVITPIGAYNLRTEKEVFESLAKLVAEYPAYPRWLIKLDRDYGNGRGTAYLDVRRLKVMEPGSEIAAAAATGPGSMPPAAALAARVLEELVESQGRRIRFVTPNVFAEWPAYAAAIHAVGGCCIEAVPAEVVSTPIANIYIEPDGQARLMSVQEQLMTPPYIVVGYSHPHNPVVPMEVIRAAAMNVAAAAYRKRIFGYMSIDFIVFKKEGAPAGAMDLSSLRMWAVDIELRWTTNAAMHSFAALAAGAQYDAESGQCVVLHQPSASASPNSHHGPSLRPLHYIYSGILSHPYIGALRHTTFFSLCRQRGLSFEPKTKTGVLYHMVDSLLKGAIGAVAIGTSEGNAVTQMIDFLDVLQQQLVGANAPFDEPNTNLPSMVAATRNLTQRLAENKKNERTHRSKK